MFTELLISQDATPSIFYKTNCSATIAVPDMAVIYKCTGRSIRVSQMEEDWKVADMVVTRKTVDTLIGKCCKYAR